MSETVRGQPRREIASVVLGRDGHFTDASQAGLELLGLTLEELKGLSPRAVMSMSDAESQALSQAWRQPGPKTAAGEATLVQPDGTRVRVKFLMTPAREDAYRVVFEPLDAPPASNFIVYTLPQVLAAWRAAERRLADAIVGTLEWDELQAEIAVFRDHYRSLVADGTSGSGNP